LRKISPNTLKR